MSQITKEQRYTISVMLEHGKKSTEIALLINKEKTTNIVV